MTTSSETAFHHPPEVVYDFVTNPANWTKTYPNSTHVGELPDAPLKVGDTWVEGGPEGPDKLTTWLLAIAVRPRMWVFNSVGRLRHDRDGNGGREGRITVAYHFTEPDPGITLFSRTMTIELPSRPAAEQVFPDGRPRQHRRVSRRGRPRTRAIDGTAP